MRRREVVLAGLALGLAGEPAIGQAQTPRPVGTLVYVGTHGNAILQGRLDSRTGKFTLIGQAAQIERPTWLLVDPDRPVLYAVSETGNSGDAQGGVFSLAIDPATGALRQISRVDSGGGGATHLAYDRRLHTLFVGNFGGGQVSAVPVRPDGSLEPVSSVRTDVGSGPLPRQTGPHAHSVAVDPSGRFLLVADMGADRIFIYRYDPLSKALSPSDPPFEQTPPGTGPRRLRFSPDGRFAYADTELSAEVRVFRWDAKAGRLTPVQTLAADKPDFKGEKSAAELVLSRDGRFAYLSNRGENSLQVYAVDRDTGLLSERQTLPGGGDVPWSFAIDRSGRWMLVANEASSTITVFGVDERSGRLAPTGQALPSPMKPVAFAFYPPRASATASAGSPPFPA